MGEAKRRKKLDPNYGKSLILKISEIYRECQKQYGNGGLVHEPSKNILVYVPEALASHFDNRLAELLSISSPAETNPFIVGQVDLSRKKTSWVVFSDDSDDFNYAVKSQYKSLAETVENLNVFHLDG